MKSKFKWIFFVAFGSVALVFAQEKTVTGVVSMLQVLGQQTPLGTKRIVQTN
jgi:hypothetical protein